MSGTGKDAALPVCVLFLIYLRRERDDEVYPYSGRTSWSAARCGAPLQQTAR